MLALLACSGNGDSPRGDTAIDTAAGVDGDGDGYSTAAGDCDDTDSTVNPAATEDTATTVDENCDGTTAPKSVHLDDIADRWNGETPGQMAGRSVAVGRGSASGGFLIGATAAAEPGDGGDGRGAAFLFEGDLEIPFAIFRDSRGLFGEAGGAVLLPGDLDGDGARDVVIAAPVIDANGLLAAGQVYVFGDPSAGEHVLDNADFILSGSSATNLGQSLDAVGDWNGDGLPELLVGATNVQETYDQSGRAYVFEGPLNAASGIEEAAATFSGGSAMDYFGMTVVSQFDDNGDGIDDVLIGALKGDPEMSGRAYLFLGPQIGDVSADDAEATFVGSSSVGEVSYSMAAGDTDGDGLADIALGAPLDDGVAERGGSAVVFSAPVSGEHTTADAQTRIESEGDHRFVGAAMSLCGDLDGDGRDDLVLGVPFDPSYSATSPGGIFVWTSLPHGTTDTGSATIALFGDLGSATGRSVATGDEDGDGLAEVLIGAPYDDEAGAVSGSVYLLHAADLGL